MIVYQRTSLATLPAESLSFLHILLIAEITVTNIIGTIGINPGSTNILDIIKFYDTVHASAEIPDIPLARLLNSAMMPSMQGPDLILYSVGSPETWPSWLHIACFCFTTSSIFSLYLHPIRSCSSSKMYRRSPIYRFQRHQKGKICHIQISDILGSQPIR